MFVVAAFLFVMAIRYIPYKLLNYIEIDEKGVYHGQDFISWENVYMTVKFDQLRYIRGDGYYVYFDDHFLSKQATDAKSSYRKKGFYIILTNKRTVELLPFCQREIRILNDVPCKIIALIKEHNSKIRASK